MRRDAPLGLLMVLILSGCLENGPAHSADGSPKFDPGALPVPGVLFEDCAGVGLGLIQPNPTRDAAPAGFRASDDPTFSGGLGTDFFSCQRVTAFNATLGPASALWAWAEVEPLDSSWAEAGTDSFFTYAVWTTHAQVAHALERLGVPATVGSLDRESMPLPGGAVVEQRAFHAKDVEIALRWVQGPETPLADEPRTATARHYWFGADETYLRLDVLERETFGIDDTLTPATVEVTGPSPFGELLDASPASALGTAFPRLSWDVSGSKEFRR